MTPPPPATPPPFRLPGEHFAAALAWLVVAGMAAPLVASDLAAGNLFSPRVLAATHALTLGVLTTMIFGALYQFFPATLGVGARSIPVAHRTFWALQAGVVAMVLGFWRWLPWLLVAGWLLLFLAVGGLSWNLLPQRRRATQGQLVGRYVSAGHMALGLAMALALARIGEPLGWWAVSRTGFIAAHFHLAALGFVSLTIVGVGSRMVPMFLFAQTAPTWALGWIGPLAAAGLVVQSAGLLLSRRPLTMAGGGLLAAAGLLLLVQLAYWFHHRARREVDPAAGFLGAAAGFLVGTMGLGIWLLAAGQFDPRIWAAYGLVALPGWATLFTLGVAHRIVPFLAWLHLFGGRGRGAHAPPVTALVHRGLAWATLAAWVTGTGLMAAAVLAAHPALATLGGVLLAAGAAGLGAQLGRGVQLWRATPVDPPFPSPAARDPGRPLEVLQ